MEKKIKTNEASCPSCGATMRYSPERKKLFCENCETCKEIPFEQILEKHQWDKREQTTKQTKEWAEETKNLKCPNCGANVILNKLEYSKSCPYCSSSLVGDVSELPSLPPDGIIPFTFSNEEAVNKYVAGIKKKWFVPNAFKKAPPVENIHGVYVPCFSYDAKTESVYSGTLATDHHYRDSNGRTHTTTTYKHISGTHKHNHVDVLVETSSKMNQKQLDDIQPYNTTEIVKFNQSFIMGYTVEHYENTVEECKVISEKIMDERNKNAILAGYHYDRVESFSIKSDFSEEKYMYYLLPTYKCDYMYKEKKYTTFMNGQTGKVGGGYPKSPVKITLFVLFILLIVIGIAVLSSLGGK